MVTNKPQLTRRSFLHHAAIGCIAVALTPSIPIRGGSEPSDGLSLKFLGTGAADWPPEDYPADKAPLLSGQYRGFSSLLVSASVLIDCGPTVPKALSLFQIDPNRITDILLTHTHADHFDRKSIEAITAQRPAGKKLNLWFHHGAAKAVKKPAGCTLRPITEYQPFRVKGIEVVPLEANHHVALSPQKPLHYLLKTKTKALLYALDGAWLTAGAQQALTHITLDAVIWDATVGEQKNDYRLFAHNNLPMIRLMNSSLSGQKIITPDTKIILSHLAKTLHPAHAILKQHLAPENILPAHDGLHIDL